MLYMWLIGAYPDFMNEKKSRRKYIFIAGGVMSGVGKGVASASLGAILKARGLKVTAVKIDPYINVDAGTMNPVEHGEVFVTADGDETDQDIGNYERFLDEDILSVNYMTTGRVYLSVIERERALGYGGKTVEVVPHVPQEVIARIEKAAEYHDADVTIVEVGGTVGEYQNILFLEAVRMMKLETPENVLIGLVSYLPIPGNLGEMKTKPTQYAVRTLNGTGLQPDFIIARGSKPLDEPRKKKIAVNCSMDVRDIVSAPDVDSIYRVPLNFEDEGIGERVVEKLGLKTKKMDLTDWTDLLERIDHPEAVMRVGIVSKYTTSGDFSLSDAYLSVVEAVNHAAWHLRKKAEIIWLDAEELERGDEPLRAHDIQALIVPGGFGSRGIEGKLRAIRYTRENAIPFLGLCLGMQLAMVEFARNVMKLPGAHTTEIEPDTQHPVISLMNEQEGRMKNKDYGGTMRLGHFPCDIREGSCAETLFGARRVNERHRHRYEGNPKYYTQFEEAGMRLSGMSPDRTLVEMIELPDHPFFMGSQFHPEYQSRPFEPHPMFVGLLRAGSSN